MGNNSVEVIKLFFNRCGVEDLNSNYSTDVDAVDVGLLSEN